jgi:hypothetical protein
MTRASFLAVIVFVTCGCSSGQNTKCRWPDEPARVLDPNVDADAQHLMRDVELVEELSVRFADASNLGPGSDKQRYRIERCYDPLMSALITRHGVSTADVHRAQSRIGERGLNLIVNAPVAIFFGVATIAVLRWIRRRFARDERLARVGATTLAGLAVPAVTVGAGRIWQMISETIRVGNGHLGGQRGLRLPWVQHSNEYFMIAVAAFALMAMLYYAHAMRSIEDTAR